MDHDDDHYCVCDQCQRESMMTQDLTELFDLPDVLLLSRALPRAARYREMSVHGSDIGSLLATFARPLAPPRRSA